MLMYNKYTKLTMGRLTIEANYDAASKPGKTFKVTMDGKSEIVPRGDIFGLLVLFGTDQEQESLATVTKTKMVLIERLLHIKTKKALKKGELITVPYTYSMTQEAYDQAIKENPRSFRKVGELSTPEGLA
jgi:hypothetical protein